MPSYPRPCSKCGALTERDGFTRDHTKPAGHRGHCKACDARRAKRYYAVHREEKIAKRRTEREAAAKAHLDRLVEANKAKVEAARRASRAAQARQDALLERLGLR